MQIKLNASQTLIVKRCIVISLSQNENQVSKCNAGDIFFL